MVQKQHTRIPPQEDIRFVFAMIARRQQIDQFQERLSAAGEKVIVALLLLILAVFFFLSRNLLFGRAPDVQPAIGITLALSSFCVALVGVAWPKRIAPGVARYLPWPRKQSLQSLLHSVPLNKAQNETILRREFEDLTEETMLMTVAQNISQLKEVLHKEDKSLLLQWQRRRTPAHKMDRRQTLRMYQRYEKLLYAEWKLFGQPVEPRGAWIRAILKILIGTAVGTLLGLAWHQWGGSASLIFIPILLCGAIGMSIVDEFFGYLLMITLWMSGIRSPFGVWMGIGSGIAFSLLWHLFIKRRRFKTVLDALQKQ